MRPFPSKDNIPHVFVSAVHLLSRLRPLDNGVPYPVAVGGTRAQVGIIPSSLVPAFVTLETHPCKKSTVVQQLVSVAGGVTGRHSGRTLAVARANSAVFGWHITRPPSLDPPEAESSVDD
ncbi:unnamed protein product [Pieris brassicae]|uniref:Uncharacterized protein n=1 Tax=Pieris brassicae TaxID=7116 RepID=A0A9P0TI40_PIEBR|nr:unnamed protein product [Pieris brassicae]